MNVTANVDLITYESVKKRIIGGFEFLMEEGANDTDRENSIELIRQFKSMGFQKFEVENPQPHLYNQTHFYAVFRNLSLSLNHEFILRIRKYNYREGYECHLSHKTIKNIDNTLNIEEHDFNFPINL